MNLLRKRALRFHRNSRTMARNNVICAMHYLNVLFMLINVSIRKCVATKCVVNAISGLFESKRKREREKTNVLPYVYIKVCLSMKKFNASNKHFTTA